MFNIQYRESLPSPSLRSVITRLDRVIQIFLCSPITGINIIIREENVKMSSTVPHAFINKQKVLKFHFSFCARQVSLLHFLNSRSACKHLTNATKKTNGITYEKIAAVFTSFYPPYSSLPNPEHLLQIQLIYQYLGP